MARKNGRVCVPRHYLVEKIIPNRMHIGFIIYHEWKSLCTGKVRFRFFRCGIDFVYGKMEVLVV